MEEEQIIFGNETEETPKLREAKLDESDDANIETEKAESGLAVQIHQTSADKSLPMSDHILLTSLDDAIPGASPTFTVKMKDSNDKVTSYKFTPESNKQDNEINDNESKKDESEVEQMDENKDLEINLSKEIADLHIYPSKGTSGGDDSKREKSKNKVKRNPLLVAAFDDKKPRIPAYIEEKQEEFNSYAFSHSNEEMDKALKKVLSKKVPPTDSSLTRDLFEYAKLKNEEAIDNEEYDLAGKLDTAVSILAKAIQQDHVSYDSIQKSQAIKSRLETVEQNKKRITEVYEQKKEAHNADTQKRMEILESEHQREIQNFEAEWSSPEAMQQYTKPSAQLLHLRRTQRQLALAHDFTQAKHVKSIAEELEAKETKEARERAAEAMKASYMQLMAKQQKEKDCLILNSERKAQLLETEYQKEMSSSEKTQKTLQNKITPTPKKPQVTVPQVEYRSHVSRSRPKSGAKKHTEGPRLDVKIDFKIISKMKTPRTKPLDL